MSIFLVRQHIVVVLKNVYSFDEYVASLWER